MAYTKTTWVDGSAPAITAAQLNRMEDGIDDAHTGAIDDGSVTNAKLEDRAAVSVMGRSANASGVVDDIVAAQNGQVLMRDSDALKFDHVDTANIENGAVTEDKISLLAVTASRLGNDAVITAKIQDDAVTTDKLADLAVTAAKLSGSTNEDEWAGQRLASLNDGSGTPPVGSLIFAKHNSALTTTYGNTRSGSDLKYSDAGNNDGASVGSGTWRALGTSNSGTATLWIRVS